VNRLRIHFDVSTAANDQISLNVKDPVIEVTFYVIDPCLTPSIIISFLFFLVTMCRLIMGFNRNMFEAQHKNSFFLSFLITTCRLIMGLIQAS
jgi:hypothetical protein